jgi:hypothetical protein
MYWYLPFGSFVATVAIYEQVIKDDRHYIYIPSEYFISHFTISERETSSLVCHSEKPRHLLGHLHQGSDFRVPLRSTRQILLKVEKGTRTATRPGSVPPFGPPGRQNRRCR